MSIKTQALTAGIGLMTISWIILLGISANPNTGCGVASSYEFPIAAVDCNSPHISPSFTGSIACWNENLDRCNQAPGKTVHSLQLAGIILCVVDIGCGILFCLLVCGALCFIAADERREDLFKTTKA